MDPSEERRTGLENAMQLLWKELNFHLEHCLSGEDDSKGVDSVQDSSKTDSSENTISSKEKRLEERESKVDAMERVLEARKKALDAKQKILEHRSLDLDSKESDLMERESKTHAEAEGIKKREYELYLREKRLEEKIMMLDVIIEGKSDPESDCAIRNDSSGKMKGVERKRKQFCCTQPQSSVEIIKKIIRVDTLIESSRARPDYAIQSVSAEKMKGIERKVLEIGESSTTPQPSGTARNVQVQEGLSFLLTILQTHEDTNYMTVPSSFVGAYDLSMKKYVILSTDKGNFRLEVKHYHDSRYETSRHVTFRRGWRYFYCMNHLNVGMKCQFRVKEHTVNGDISVFSMQVFMLGH